MNGMTDHFLMFCRSKNVETGGILIGIANYKSKVIHVFDIVSEPRGSKGTCVGFTRGIDGLPEQVNEIKRQTGQIIGYVGEWHTHPMNLEWLSSTDHDTIKKLQKINRRVPIPTLALIVTNVKVLPYVFP
jgi:integrative and conjugative element protein (TIGR02256 family)